MKRKVQVCILLIVIFSSKAFCQVENSLSTKDKIYGLSLLWKEVSYNFAFFHQIPDLDWDSCYQAYIPRVMESKNDWDYYQELQRFMSLLHDGHTRVFPPEKLRNKYYGSTTKQITTRLIDGKIIITRVLQDSLINMGLKQGMEIVSIDNMDPVCYANKYVAPYVYASTPQYRQLEVFGEFLLSGSTSVPINLVLKDPEGNMVTYRLTREPWIMEKEILLGDQMTFEVLADNIGYLKINNFAVNKNFRSTFDSIFRKVLSTDGLIIDVRSNIGGTTENTQYVLKHLTDKKFKSAKWRTPRNIAAYRSWGHGIEWFEDEGYEVHPPENITIYSKPVDVLTDESTFSSAEDFCVGFLTLERGKLIGTRTAGSSGNPLVINIPGGGAALISTKQDFFPDGREYVGFGIPPDIEVKPSITDIEEKRDRVLETACKDILQKSAPTPGH
jgi:carboxyl-terminal processing protease